MKEWLYRRVPAAVALLGGVGLGTTLTYFFGMYLAVVYAGYPAWSQFFVRWGTTLALVPVSTLAVYLAVRSRVGGWLVERGAYGTAAAYASERLAPGLLRGEAEAWRHHEALVRAEMARGREGAARDALTGETGRQLGEQRAAWLAWRLELADEPEVDGMTWQQRDVSLEVIDDTAVEAGDQTAARLWSVAAEMVARGMLSTPDGKPSAQQLVSRARQRLDQWARIDVAEAVTLTLTSESRDDWERADSLLETSFDAVLEERPVRRVELTALRAELAARLGERERASALLETAAEGEAATKIGRQMRERVRDRYGLDR